MRILFLFLGLLLAVYAQEETTTEPFEGGGSLDLVMDSTPMEPHPTPEPEPTPKVEMKDAPTDAPTPEPEPAIKFDNIQSEDYGDAEEVAKNIPDELNDEIITDLVNNFLNTGSVQGNATKPTFANPAVNALIGSSNYWKTDNVQPAGSIKDPEAAKTWVSGYQTDAQKIMQEVAKSGWRHIANASNGTKRALDEAENALAQFVRSTSLQAKQFDKSAITDPAVLRQLEFVTFEGMSALSPEEYAAYNNAEAQVNILATNAAICDKDAPPPCALKKADLPSIFVNEKDASRLSHLWINYLTNIADAKLGYSDIVKFSTKGAQVNGYSDAGAMWRSGFDLSSKAKKPVIDFNKQMKSVYDKIEPFYKQLHAYMRRQIAGIYQNAVDLSKDGPIPAHLFGSLAGGDWSAHYEMTKPFEDEDELASDLLTAFRMQNFTAKTIFEKGYRYFKSAGFPHLPKSYWTSSFFERVWSKNMICEPAAAIDMRDGQDFRVKACAQMGEPDFQMAHSLLAQTFYQYLYKDQPFLFRETASASIKDAIGKVFAHLATNVDYLYSQKLISSEHLDIKESVTINKLYKEALSNIAKIPFNLAADNWRYELFEGKISTEKSNDRWWQLRKTFEGVRSPQPYNSSNLDALMYPTISQIHSPASKDVVSHVIQFQILKSICPEGVILSEGCILSEETTEKLRKTMALGSSITWVKALEMITGSTEIDATPLLEYYEPLINWLRNTNEITEAYVGWDGEGTPFSPDDIPKPRMGSEGSSGIVSADRVAFPGGECSHGQDCLLESTCNGTHCVCNAELFTLTLGDTTSCVAGNPADLGFLTEDGGVNVDLVPAATTEAPVTSSTTRRPTRVKASNGLQLVPTLVLLLSTLFVL